MDSNDKERNGPASVVSRRQFVSSALAGGAVASAVTLEAQPAEKPADLVKCSLTINGQRHEVQVDLRATLLDLLREQLHLTGTKKGCDHGQCGACTVLVNGVRMNSCMTLAVMRDGDEVTTIEGLAKDGSLHPMQAAFIDTDGFQCGYCTPGQICSAVAMLQELKAGAPSAVTSRIALNQLIELTDDEIRERMSGNICRCGAYGGIVAAIRQVYNQRNS